MRLVCCLPAAVRGVRKTESNRSWRATDVEVICTVLQGKVMNLFEISRLTRHFEIEN
jgi:hypothetical protein